MTPLIKNATSTLANFVILKCYCKQDLKKLVPETISGKTFLRFYMLPKMRKLTLLLLVS